MYQFFFIILGLFGILYGNSFTTLPSPVPGKDPSSFQGGITNCYISDKKQIFLTWLGTSSVGEEVQTFFAVYDINSKNFTIESTAFRTLNIASEFQRIYCCYNENEKKVYLCWKEGESDSSMDQFPYFCTYDPETVTFTDPIQISLINVGSDIVTCCYNSTVKKVVFAWKDNVEFLPYYRVVQGGSLKNEGQITNDNTAQYNVYCCSGDLDRVYFSFSNLQESTFDSSVQIHFYDFAKNLTGELSRLENIYPAYDVFCSYDSFQKQVILSWALEQQLAQYTPFYGICNIAQPDLIQAFPLSNNIFSNFQASVFSSYNPKNKSCLFLSSRK